MRKKKKIEKLATVGFYTKQNIKDRVMPGVLGDRSNPGKNDIRSIVKQIHTARGANPSAVGDRWKKKKK